MANKKQSTNKEGKKIVFDESTESEKVLSREQTSIKGGFNFLVTELKENRGFTNKQIYENLNISKSSFYRYIRGEIPKRQTTVTIKIKSRLQKRKPIETQYIFDFHCKSISENKPVIHRLSIVDIPGLSLNEAKNRAIIKHNSIRKDTRNDTGQTFFLNHVIIEVEFIDIRNIYK